MGHRLALKPDGHEEGKKGEPELEPWQRCIFVIIFTSIAARAPFVVRASVSRQCGVDLVRIPVFPFFARRGRIVEGFPNTGVVWIRIGVVAHTIAVGVLGFVGIGWKRIGVVAHAIAVGVQSFVGIGWEGIGVVAHTIAVGVQGLTRIGWERIEVIGDTIAVGVKIGNHDLKRIFASEHPF